MRGAQIIQPLYGIILRIIPADAGSTRIARGVTFQPQDHPRGCGEHRQRERLLLPRAGSSPRMRGARRHRRCPCVPRRIIPADAGSTDQTGQMTEGVRDHPRGCGEHARHHDHRHRRLGSSPRMRGAPLARPGHHQPVGIIPADAGSTNSMVMWLNVNGDHPRGCGEHVFHPFLGSSPSGSSPRMRGAPERDERDHAILRIIPADAGSTPRIHDWRPAGQDHPRGCGEHSSYRQVPFISDGSSPRMRGAPGHAGRAEHPGGIIPADAGSTSGSVCNQSPFWDHPRGCGEHT